MLPVIPSLCLDSSAAPTASWPSALTASLGHFIIRIIIIFSNHYLKHGTAAPRKVDYPFLDNCFYSTQEDLIQISETLPLSSFLSRVAVHDQIKFV